MLLGPNAISSHQHTVLLPFLSMAERLAGRPDGSKAMSPVRTNERLPPDLDRFTDPRSADDAAKDCRLLPTPRARRPQADHPGSRDSIKLREAFPRDWKLEERASLELA